MCYMFSNRLMVLFLVECWLWFGLENKHVNPHTRNGSSTHRDVGGVSLGYLQHVGAVKGHKGFLVARSGSSRLSKKRHIMSAVMR